MTETNRGLLLIISGPSGVGKTKIVEGVAPALGAQFSVSATTRPPRQGETDGVDYRFVSASAFEQMRNAGELLEWAQVHGNYYGTPRNPVEQAIKTGKVIILDIDVQGGIQVKKAMPDALAVFILPPSEQVLLRRLRDRKTDSEQAVQRRFANSKREIAIAKECGAYDHFVVNEDGRLDAAIAETVSLVQKRLGRAG